MLPLLALAKPSARRRPSPRGTGDAVQPKGRTYCTHNKHEQTKNVAAGLRRSNKSRTISASEARYWLDSFEVGINVFTPDPDVFGTTIKVRGSARGWIRPVAWSVFEMQRPPFCAVKPVPMS